MKSPLNIEIQRIKPRNDFKSFMKNIKKQLESVHHLCANGPRFKQTTNPRLNYSPSVPPPPPSLLNNQLSFPRQSEWRKKLPRRSSRMHRLRTIVLTRKYVLSSLSCCQYRFLFADLPKVDVVSRFIPFIADNFVRLASPATVSKPNDQFESAVYHIRGGRGGRREEEAQFNRGNRAIFPAIVPSSPPPPPPSLRDRKPSTHRSIESRTRSSYFCIHVVQFSRNSPSDLAVHLRRASFFRSASDRFLLC